MALLPPKRKPAKTTDPAQPPEPKPEFPGCATMFLAGVTILMICMGIIGLLLLFGVNLHAKVWLVLPIFVFGGAFMLRLARAIHPYVKKKKDG